MSDESGFRDAIALAAPSCGSLDEFNDPTVQNPINPRTEGTGTLVPLLSGVIPGVATALSQNGSSPTETDHEWIAKFEGFHGVRDAA